MPRTPPARRRLTGGDSVRDCGAGTAAGAFSTLGVVQELTERCLGLRVLTGQGRHEKPRHLGCQNGGNSVSS